MLALLMVASIEGTIRFSQVSRHQECPLPLKKSVPNSPPTSQNFPYFYQLNNKYDPYGSCLLTSTAMVLGCLGKTVSPDSLYLEFQKRNLDRFLHSDIQYLLNEYEIDDNWSTNHQWSRVISHLKAGYPAIFSGPVSFTSRGHVIVLLGVEDDNFSCHDPYGKFDGTKYLNKPEAGKFVHYSRELIFAQSAGGSATTWAHLCQPHQPLKRVIGDENCSQQFKNKVRLVAKKINCDPSDLMAVISWESDGTFSPSKQNYAGSGATGLIQFMPHTALALGTTTQVLAQMTALDQLDYVEEYFNMIDPAKLKKSLADLYMAVLYPKAIGKSLNYGLFTTPGIAYQQNSGLDINRDGTISVSEAVAKIQARFI
ncbi:C39 family peptidase [Gloeothece verrucosa]|uniref:Peptidase C39-like domain-containing protein n=1 Tax=Gloeothece verrucosa (strain PCC 7822) TaxID=497965 RepID=E0UAF7_GLOV7|nr:C39 family peptidase [Gloeothece verrucosa]ADN12698.1 hypothetical protein Cyan7822_0662 [Gloeothece verrucosa PCC 7822]